MAIFLAAGCVSIYDSKVQVRAPEQMDIYNRSLVEQCTPQTYPHRLIQAQANVGSPLLEQGGAMVYTQAEFDKWWAGIVPQLDQAAVVSTDSKPVINWEQQYVYFVPVNLANACDKAKPFGDEMVTDCHNLNILIYRYREGTNCQQPAASMSVYVYIFPRPSVPVGIQWVYPTVVPTPVPTATYTLTPTPTPAVKGKKKK